jgi:hypothetical protein
MRLNEAIDCVAEYLADEQADFMSRPADERERHIWGAVEVLIEHRTRQRSRAERLRALCAADA